MSMWTHAPERTAPDSRKWRIRRSTFLLIWAPVLFVVQFAINRFTVRLSKSAQELEQRCQKPWSCHGPAKIPAH